MNEIIFPVVGALVFAFGLLFAFGTLLLFVRKVWKIKNATKTTGVVINVEVREGMQQSQFDGASPRNTLFKPTVRFQTEDGRIIDYTPNISNSWSNYKTGENIPVYYDPRHREKPIIGRSYNLWFPFFLFGFVSIIFTFVGGIFLLVGLSFRQ